MGRIVGIPREENCLWNDVFVLSIESTDQVSTINVSNKLAHHQRERLTALVSIKLSDSHDLIWKPLNNKNIARLSPTINEDRAGIVIEFNVREVLFAPLSCKFQTNTSSLILLISTYSSVPSTKTSVRRRSNAHTTDIKDNSIAKNVMNCFIKYEEKELKEKIDHYNQSISLIIIFLACWIVCNIFLLS